MEKNTQVFDVCIICALYEEARAVLEEFSSRCGISFTRAFSSLDHYEYRHAALENDNRERLTILVTWPSSSGSVQIGLDLKPLLSEFCPRFIAMTGFCAGYKKKVRRGDLVIAEYAYHYEEGKVITAQEGSSLHQSEMNTAGPSSQVIQYARGFEGWKELVREMKRDMLQRDLKTHEEPRCVIAPMASGMAVRQDDPFLWLREKYNRNTVALDMEAATFYRALRAIPHIHAIVVKGVCDYADMHKNDRYHDYAARVSAVYLLSFLRTYVTEQTIPRRGAFSPASRTGTFTTRHVFHQPNPSFTERAIGLQYLPPLHRPPREKHFRDREQERNWLLDHLQPGRVVTLWGPAGIGKTALVADVLWQLSPGNNVPDDFPDGIFFYNFQRQAKAAMALEQLALTFGVESRPDPELAAQRALNRKCALLVFDGAEEADHLEDVLNAGTNCAVLVISRRPNDAIDLEYQKYLPPLEIEDGVAVIQAWGKGQAADELAIIDICKHIGGLPLALRLVGRYLALHKEEAGEYLRWLQDTPWAALHHGESEQESIRILLDRSVTKLSEDAKQILVIIGLLAPAAFDRNILAQVLKCSDRTAKQAIDELQEYSLVVPVEKTYKVSHALIHMYARDRLSIIDDRVSQRKQLSEYLIQVLDRQLSSTGEINKHLYGQMLPHVQSCLALLDQYALFPLEAARLFSSVGAYLFIQRRYTEAEPLYQRALVIYQRILGPEHSETVISFTNLAELYREQGRYDEAEPLYHRALIICKQMLGPEHPNTAIILTNLAELYREQGRYDEAEPLYRQSLALREQALGPEHPDAVISLINLATLYQRQGKHKEAEPLYRRALIIREQLLKPEHPNTATSLTNLATFYREQGRYDEAEPLYHRALMIFEQTLGSEHPNTAIILTNLAELYREQGRYDEAEPSYRRALVLREQTLGPEHPDTATSLTKLAELYHEQGRYDETEPLYYRALMIREQTLGPEHPETKQVQEIYRVLLLTMKHLR